MRVVVVYVCGKGGHLCRKRRERKMEKMEEEKEKRKRRYLKLYCIIRLRGSVNGLGVNTPLRHVF